MAGHLRRSTVGRLSRPARTPVTVPRPGDRRRRRRAS